MCWYTHKLGICMCAQRRGWMQTGGHECRKAHPTGVHGCSTARVLHAYPNLCVFCIACSHLHADVHKGVHNIHKCSEKLCLCRSRILVPNRHIELSTAHSTSTRSGNVPQSLDGVSQSLCCHRRTLTQPHRDKDRENSGNNLKSLSRTHFNSQKSAELNSICPSLTRAGALTASV